MIADRSPREIPEKRLPLVNVKVGRFVEDDFGSWKPRRITLA
jgi:hypothetical protein